MGMDAESFRRSLIALDPEFSLRKGRYMTTKWVIERRACSYIPPSEIEHLQNRFRRLERILLDTNLADWDAKKATYDGIGEDLHSLKRGYRVIVIAEELTPRLYDAICMGDMLKYGGYARIADEMEAYEAKQEEALERKQQGQREDIASETYDILNFLWRKRETDLLHGETNLNKMLHGRPSNKPVIQLTD